MVPFVITYSILLPSYSDCPSKRGRGSHTYSHTLYYVANPSAGSCCLSGLGSQLFFHPPSWQPTSVYRGPVRSEHRGCRRAPAPTTRLPKTWQPRSVMRLVSAYLPRILRDVCCPRIKFGDTGYLSNSNHSASCVPGGFRPVVWRL